VGFSDLSISELGDETGLAHSTVPTQQDLHQTVIVTVHLLLLSVSPLSLVAQLSLA
jgi:hypothetical protein